MLRAIGSTVDEAGERLLQTKIPAHPTGERPDNNLASAPQQASPPPAAPRTRATERDRTPASPPVPTRRQMGPRHAGSDEALLSIVAEVYPRKSTLNLRIPQPPEHALSTVDFGIHIPEVNTTSRGAGAQMKEDMEDVASAFQKPMSMRQKNHVSPS